MGPRSDVLFWIHTKATALNVSGVGAAPQGRSVLDTHEGYGPSVSGVGVGPHAL